MEIEPIRAIGSQVATLPNVSELRAVADSEIERFERLVRIDEVAHAEPGEIQQGMLYPESDATLAINESRSLGEALVDGIAHVKSDFDARFARLTESIKATEGQEITMQQALSIQYELMQVGLSQELTAKLADKTSSGVQTLFRNQG